MGLRKLTGEVRPADLQSDGVNLAPRKSFICRAGNSLLVSFSKEVSVRYEFENLASVVTPHLLTKETRLVISLHRATAPR
jgi:hypothetical protein